MFSGRGPGGPKPSAWTKAEGQRQEAFFARQEQRQRSGGAGAAELEWVYSIDGDETHQARVQINGLVKHLTFGVTGTVLWWKCADRAAGPLWLARHRRSRPRSTRWIQPWPTTFDRDAGSCDGFTPPLSHLLDLLLECVRAIPI